MSHLIHQLLATLVEQHYVRHVDVFSLSQQTAGKCRMATLAPRNSGTSEAEGAGR